MAKKVLPGELSKEIIKYLNEYEEDIEELTKDLSSKIGRNWDFFFPKMFFTLKKLWVDIKLIKNTTPPIVCFVRIMSPKQIPIQASDFSLLSK